MSTAVQNVSKNLYTGTGKIHEIGTFDNKIDISDKSAAKNRNQIVKISTEMAKFVSCAQRNFAKLVEFGSCLHVKFLLRLACNENAVYRALPETLPLSVAKRQP